MAAATLTENEPGASPPEDEWMLRNVTAIRENTERILELVEAERTPAGGACARPRSGVRHEG